MIKIRWVWCLMLYAMLERMVGFQLMGMEEESFFEEKFAETLKLLVKGKYHNLCIVSSQELVNVQLYQELCEGASLIIAHAYPWPKINIAWSSTPFYTN